MTPDLKSYDWIVINSSGGKDSQAMMDYVYEQLDELYRDEMIDMRDNVIVVHADLGRVEWKGTPELAERQAAHYGFQFVKVSRPQGDLLEEIEKRGMFPSSTARYCTAHHKRGQIHKVFTKLADEARLAAHDKKYQTRILNCMGMRAEESPARAKKPEFAFDPQASNGRRHVDNWLPIHTWTVEQVWDRIRESGVEHHWAYDAGMPRLSCCFCVLASKSALIRAAQLNPSLAEEYAALEERIDHTFQAKLSMREIIQQAKSQDNVEVEGWVA